MFEDGKFGRDVKNISKIPGYEKLLTHKLPAELAAQDIEVACSNVKKSL